MDQPPTMQGDRRTTGNLRRPKLHLDQFRCLRFSDIFQKADGKAESQNLQVGLEQQKDGTFTCELCARRDLQPGQSIDSHCSSKKHKTAVCLLRLREKKKAADMAASVPTTTAAGTAADATPAAPGGQPPKRLRIESDAYDPKKDEHSKVVLLGETREEALGMTFTLTNVSANSVFSYSSWDVSTISREFTLLEPDPQPSQLGPNVQLKLTMKLAPQEEFVHAFKAVFRFEDLSRKTSTSVFCNVKVSFVSTETKALSATGAYFDARQRRPARRAFYRRGAAIPGQPLPSLDDRDSLEKDRPLPWFDMMEHVYRFINHGLLFKAQYSPEEAEELNAYKQALSQEEVTMNNYQTRFSFLLYLEEHQTDVDMESYFMERVRLSRNGYMLCLECQDYFVVQMKLGPHLHSSSSSGVSPRERLLDMFHEGMEFCVRFNLNRIPLRIQHRALSLIDSEESCLENLLFPTEDTARTQGFLLPDNAPFRYFSNNPEPNPEQARAIRHIVLGSSRPAPYIVFGPPGTGKTFTIVEAIKQVVDHFPEARVMACAPSNSAADLITERLVEHLKRHHVFRINAFSRSLATIPGTIRDVCNLNAAGEVYYPSKQDLIFQGTRVFVTTLITAGRMVSADFEEDFFTHVFIDEASHATEPEALTALAGLLYMGREHPAGKQVVLAGDPKQLGPILRSPFARKFKLGMYLHCSPNSRLTASGSPAVTHRMCGWSALPNKDRPVLFHAVVGEDMQEASSPSFFNPFEVRQVLHYVGLLVNQTCPRGALIQEEHIGIISPYRKQVQKIKAELLQRGLDGIKVGSVEEFQGQERQVIILSTVRSNPRFLATDNKFAIGFLQNSKRFNVAVTRAKALLIVIGNPNVLRHNKSWSSFVESCKVNGCMVNPHVDRCDEDETFKKLCELLEQLETSDTDDFTPEDLAQISAVNNETVFQQDE
ncbi:putative helicase MOV-10 [Babylonia areolata]|uniref:putative helicase MOV-10 n=1 Tax=Babylonia areolata TaxID=304850 RepID=UPI003FD5F2BE